MRTTMTVHLDDAASVTATIRTTETGNRYIVLTITGSADNAYPYLAIFPAGPEFLGKLANECERAVREFVGDVP